MRSFATIFLALALACSLGVAQESSSLASAEPFKVGTFEINGVPQVGIVLRDRLIVALNPANEALRRSASRDFTELWQRIDRLRQLAQAQRRQQLLNAE